MANPKDNESGKATATATEAAPESNEPVVEVKQPEHDGPLARYEGVAPEPTKVKGQRYLPCPMCTNQAPVDDAGVVSCPRCGSAPAGATF
jgi:hypothetical protein